ncbi:DUF1967 domain-containing protein [Patescibacteria group bacterium]|nr:DUF1967 domain-containing protein [Patescibacteria group bacterium]
MIDASRYEQGIEEFGKLCDEITHYMRETFMQSRDFGSEITGVKFQLKKENGKLFLQVHATIGGEQKILMEKMMMVLLNKADILDDAEVIAEYTTHFMKHAQEYLKGAFGVKIDKDEMPIFIVSAIAQTGLTEWLDLIQHYLQYDRDHTSLLLFDIVPIADKPVGHIREVTAETLPWLVENLYVEQLDVKYAKVREVADAEFCRLAYMLPWGNDEAELRFRNVMSKKRFVAKLETAGLVKGDIIKIKSLYNGLPDRFIRY